MSTRQPLPDVLLMVTTQWRGQALRAAGDPFAQTPFLDSLLADGVWFPFAFSNHPFGPFARAVLLTGTLCPANGVKTYYDPLPDSGMTLAHLFQEWGYTTAFFGKWHLASRDPQAHVVGETHARTLVPERARGGFGYWEGFESGFLLQDPWLHGSRFPSPLRHTGYQPAVLTERVLAYLEDLPTQKPLFGVWSTEAPHPPYAAHPSEIPGPSIDSFPPNVPQDTVLRETAREELSGYYSHLQGCDKAMAALHGGWKKRRNRPLLTIFLSTHGDMHGAHGLRRKGWPYAESLLVPMIWHYPEILPGGIRADYSISLADVSATLASCLGFRLLGGPRDGVGSLPSQWGTVRRDPVWLSLPVPCGFPHNCDYAWEGAWLDPFLIVSLPEGRLLSVHNLREDPWQLHNLLEDPGKPDSVARMATGVMASFPKHARCFQQYGTPV